jgi:hypothetical protein
MTGPLTSRTNTLQASTTTETKNQTNRQGIR